MPRIRSIHPDQWTDEDFVELSPMARLLALGIRNLADDKGVFEWKPLTIKMRLFPVDNVEIDTLLVELVSKSTCTQYEIDGKKYGAIRNFQKYQKPKNPNDIYPLPDELSTYVGCRNGEFDTAERVEIPVEGEIRRQMERRGEDNSLSNDKHVDFDEFWVSWPSKVSKATAKKAWQALGPEEKRKAAENASSWFSQWRNQNPRASAIGASRYLSERRWEDGAEGVTKIDRASKLAFYADLINGDKFIAKGSISEPLKAELLDAGLVTEERMKERGVAA